MVVDYHMKNKSTTTGSVEHEDWLRMLLAFWLSTGIASTEGYS